MLFLGALRAEGQIRNEVESKLGESTGVSSKPPLSTAIE